MAAFGYSPRIANSTVAAPQRMGRWNRAGWVRAAVLGVGGLCVIGFAVLGFVRRTPAAGIAQLAELSGERVADGRLTGGFRFAAGEPSRSRDASRAVSSELLTVIARLQKTADSPSPRVEDLHAFAIARAVQHRYAEAETILQSVTAGAASADAWSDLAAVQLTIGEPQDIARAVSAAERALRREPKHPEALFNRALALQRLQLQSQALRAWREYLAIGNSSPWAAEANAYVARITQSQAAGPRNVGAALSAALDAGDASRAAQLAGASPQEARDLLEDELLGQWFTQHTNVTTGVGDRDAMTTLVAAIGERSGDPLLPETVRTYNAAPRAARVALAQAHVDYARGRALYERFALADATPLFESAGRTMLRHGDPFWRWCFFYTAAVAYQQNDLKRSLDSLQRLDAQSRRYGAIGARIAWLKGIIAATWNNFDEAFLQYRSALRFYQKAGEPDNIASVHSLLADNYLLMGAERQAWESQFEALSVDFSLLRPRRQQLVAFTGMQASIRSGSPEAALHFNAAFIESAAAARSATAAAEGHLHRARLHFRLGDCAGGRASLLDAERQLAAAEQTGGADFLRAQIPLVRAGAPECDVTQDRLPSLSSAVDIFQRANRAIWLPRALLARAREYRRLGRLTDASDDLRTGIEMLERAARGVNSSALRIEYTDDAWDLFDEMIDVQLARNQPEEAWEFAERGHMQSGRQTGPVLNVKEVSTRLPAGHALAYYVLTRTQAVLFLFDRRGFSTHRLRPDAAALTGRINAFTQKLQRGEADAETRALSELLYDDLLAQAVDGLPDDTRIHIVADGSLHQLPFHALKPRGDSRYVFERFLITTAASAKSLLSERERAPRDSIRTTALVFGDAKGDDFGSAMPSLPYAAREASAVARLYKGADLFLGERATRTEFLHKLPAARIVHVAGHAIVDERHPEFSRLIFARPAAGAPGHIFVRELADLSLPHTQLVVLAACATGAGAIFKGLGALSLASPFVAAGVPAVVSTLWPIDDRSGSLLFTEFHKSAASGVDPDVALRRAQRAVLHDPSSTPWAWAAVNMFTTLEQR